MANHPADLNFLETKIDALIRLCHQLTEENQMLREEQADLMSERSHLLEKNSLARTRIEGIVQRLKSIEAGSQQYE